MSRSGAHCSRFHCLDPIDPSKVSVGGGAVYSFNVNGGVCTGRECIVMLTVSLVLAVMCVEFWIAFSVGLDNKRARSQSNLAKAASNLTGVPVLYSGEIFFIVSAPAAEQ